MAFTIPVGAGSANVPSKYDTTRTILKRAQVEAEMLLVTWDGRGEAVHVKRNALHFTHFLGVAIPCSCH